MRPMKFIWMAGLLLLCAAAPHEPFQLRLPVSLSDMVELDALSGLPRFRLSSAALAAFEVSEFDL